MQEENDIKLEFTTVQNELIEEEIIKLEKRLQKLLEREQYERAAEIVEKINELKKHL
jgi:protein-arginine kinase activator protein McsA